MEKTSVPESMQWMVYATRWSMREHQREMQANGLSHAKLHALVYLAYHPHTRFVDLARYSDVSRAAASQLVNGLEAMGYIQRQSDPRDKRNKTLALTEKGQALVNQSMAKRYNWLERILHSLNAEEARLFHQLSSLLNRKVKDIFPEPENEKTEN